MMSLNGKAKQLRLMPDEKLELNKTIELYRSYDNYWNEYRFPIKTKLILPSDDGLWLGAIVELKTIMNPSFQPDSFKKSVGYDKICFVICVKVWKRLK